MRVEVTGDNSRREITFKIEEGTAPDIDVTEKWHSKPRLIRPARGSLIIVNGEQRQITVYGGLVLKSGKASTEIEYKRMWRATSTSLLERERIEKAPEWVQLVWQHAPRGVTTWSWDAFGELITAG